MSGSSGGGGYGGGYDDRETSCEDLVIHTQINSPQPNAVAGIQVNEVLQVTTLKSSTGPIPVVMRNGTMAGGIMVPKLGKLLSCIAAGHVYKATVTAVNGGQIKVTIDAV